ncbi:hypothetical protein HFP15_17050 [Amycolatopsis sp. K13G38]|uniref:Prenyltransferase n=1 Tax=Amycolatopsis acididurans TaxID=2724524 RepID=A0ABX1J476_9PSEU|nr:hypothetical protein [Amycolatopsis acididurans]NKQ54591.1 hypothetical protein [Amycolatopsis acididurans]
MTINLSRAGTFMAGCARILDRRRFELLTGGDPAARDAVLAAVDGYRNADGGYGWGLEPDLRAAESQPGGALHAMEAIADAGPATSPRTAALLDWLQAAGLPDGGLPFALPIGDPTACAPFWVQADPHTSSLQITAAVAAQAYRVAQWDDDAKNHPWLETVTHYCFDTIARISEPPFAYVLSFALRFLDAAADHHPEAHKLLAHLGQFVPSDGAVPVAGGSPGETLHLLDFAPEPGRPVRALVDDAAVAADLDRLENGQQPDGGWSVDFASYSEAAALEWRGYATVNAVAVLRMNGRLG